MQTREMSNQTNMNMNNSPDANEGGSERDGADMGASTANSQTIQQAHERQAHSADSFNKDDLHITIKSNEVDCQTSESNPSNMKTAGNPPFGAHSHHAATSSTIGTVPRTNSGRSRKLATPPVLEPPVTAYHLHYLWIENIMFHPKLRHDINFDPHLRYTAVPKIHAAEFWVRLEKELSEFTLTPVDFQASHGLTWTLPATLNNVRDILRTLVPSESVDTVSQGLDVELIMQQLSMGVADLESVADWLAEFLISCCAPMRDRKVEDMRMLFIEGHRRHDVKVLVKGVKELLSIVESMALVCCPRFFFHALANNKQDVANHRIRVLRPWIIENTVVFERGIHQERVRTGYYDVVAAYDWYMHYQALEITPQFQHEGRWGPMFKGIVDSLRYPYPNISLPTIFVEDYERISNLRVHVLWATSMEICIHYFGVLMSESMPEYYLNTRHPDGAQIRLRRNITDIVSTYDSDDVKLDSDELASLPPLLVNLVMTKRLWAVAAPAIALEILRATTLPLTMLPDFEHELATSMNDHGGAIFQGRQKEVIIRLGQLIESALDEWEYLSNYELYAAAAKNPAMKDYRGYWISKADERLGSDMYLRNVARQTAHMGIHHWRIWEETAYSSDSLDLRAAVAEQIDSVYTEPIMDCPAQEVPPASIEEASKPVDSSPMDTFAIEAASNTVAELADSVMGSLKLVEDATAGASGSHTPKPATSPLEKAKAKRQNSVCSEEFEKVVEDKAKPLK